MADLSPDIFRKVTAYLDDLPAHVLVDLVHRIDHAALSEDLDAAQAMLRDAARDVLCKHEPWGALVAEPADLALSAILPFRIDARTEDRHAGRIEAGNIRRIWQELLRADADAEQTLIAMVRRAAGSIARASPAGEYLRELGVDLKDFNSYGSRRGNHEVMVRGTFANIRLRNQLAPGTEGGWRAGNTAPAHRVTGRPRARRCSASGP